MKEIVLRLVGQPYEGQWWTVRDDNLFLWAGGSFADTIEMVATGCVEWDGDRCGEIYVPVDQLPLWRLEFDCEAAPG